MDFKQYQIFLDGSLGLSEISSDVKKITEVVYMNRNRDFSPIFDNVKITVTNYDPLKYVRDDLIYFYEEGVRRFAGSIGEAIEDKKSKLWTIDVINIFKKYAKHTTEELTGTYDPAYISAVVTPFKNETDRSNFITINRIKTEGVIKAIFESDFEGLSLTADLDFSSYIVYFAYTLDNYFLDERQIHNFGREEYDEDFVFSGDPLSVLDLLEGLAMKIGFTFEMFDDTIKILKYDATIVNTVFNTATNQDLEVRATNSEKTSLIRKNFLNKRVDVLEKYCFSPLAYYGGIYLNISSIRISTALDTNLITGGTGYAGGVFIQFDQTHYLNNGVVPLNAVAQRIKGTTDYDGEYLYTDPETPGYYITTNSAIVLVTSHISNSFSTAYSIPQLAGIQEVNERLFNTTGTRVGLTHNVLANLLIFRTNWTLPNMFFNYTIDWTYGFHLKYCHEYYLSLLKKITKFDNTEDLDDTKSPFKKSITLGLKNREYTIVQEETTIVN